MLKLLLRLFIGGIVLTCLAIFAGLTYLGITPLSKVFGTGQHDLGITVSQAETTAAINKVGTQIVALPADTPAEMGFRLEGSRKADFTMDSQELSAHSNNRPWKNYPLKNVQIKIHDDGTIESSAILVIDKAMPYAMGLGYSEAQIRDAMAKYAIPPISVPIYIKGKGSVLANRTSVAAETVKLGNVTIPTDIVQQANAAAEVVLDDLITRNKQSFNCESLSFQDGKMRFKGTVAEKQFVVTE